MWARFFIFAIDMFMTGDKDLKPEQETVINFDNGAQSASIYTASPPMMRVAVMKNGSFLYCPYALNRATMKKECAGERRIAGDGRRNHVQAVGN